MSSPSLHQGGVVVDQLRADVSDQQAVHGELAQESHGGIHGWWHIFEFPRGCFSPLCSCGWFDAERWFPTQDAALESGCPRRERDDV
jgi:hypothetical protein